MQSGVQYYVQVCNSSTPVVGTLVDHKLSDKEFVEWDMNANPATPRPMGLTIKHQDGKPSNNDTIQVDWTEALAEVTCARRGARITRRTRPFQRQDHDPEQSALANDSSS